MQLTVLGTSAPFPVPGNACSGYLVRSGQDASGLPGEIPDARRTSLWVEAGSGTLAELQRHIALDELDGIFVSHRHADHTADLLVAYYALKHGPAAAGRGDRRVPLFGPEGLAERLADFLGPDSLNGLASVFEFTQMHGWGEARVGALAVEWGPVSHGVPAFGVTVRELTAEGGGTGEDAQRKAVDGAGATTGRRGFTYSGDTAPCTSLVELAEASGTLLCEVGYSEVPGGERVHCTPEDAGRLAAEAGVSTLVLTHISSGLDPAEAATRATSTFAGEVRVATPSESYTV